MLSMVRPFATLAFWLALASAAGAQPVLPPERPPANQPANNPNQPAGAPNQPAGQLAPQSPEDVPVFQPGADDSFVLVQRDGAGELIPLAEPADVAAVWHVPMTGEETEKVRQIVQERREIFDAAVIRRFDRALDIVRARG